MIDTSLRVIPATPEEWLGPLPIGRQFPQPDQPLEIDLGCGKGRFLLAHAAKHPDINFWGIDRMLRRIRKIDNRARRLDLTNIRLSRMEAYYATAYWVPPASVQTYYIFFPDPWPKARHESHRLFNPVFLDALYRTLRPDGRIHIATDHTPYFDQLSAIFAADPRFAPTSIFAPPADEQTDFELYYVDKTPISRLSLRRA